MKKKLRNIVFTVLGILIPVYIVTVLPDHVDWFEKDTENMSKTEKYVYYTEKIQEDSTDADAFLERGIVLYEKSNYDLAIEDLTKAIELDPKDDWAYYYRSQAYSGKLDSKKALADLRKCLEINPDNEIAKSRLDAFMGR